ncbi:Beta-carotene ketolase [Fibrella aestuarina BUZ 2]|uniref:Beta-carotene ketolase n=1 Tax=Fibrella aestuarina BUZ 2 TaxID=1166018 RepID=I0KBM1_9BACT|nr:fatty acid desaturase [Fibrella aestuarina]CCH01524.1 Beta-carotene ketolase [Fibrella aestuarina BUZ 2]
MPTTQLYPAPQHDASARWYLTNPYRGVAIGLTILVGWFGLLAFLLNYTIDWTNPLTYLLVLLQTHLYTGMFITAHDAIHGVVAPTNRRLNDAIGWVATTLFAFNNYAKLTKGHHLHHKHAATDHDPDFHRGNANILLWFLAFARSYVTIWQVLLMALTYNVLKIWFPMENLILYWMVPAILSTFQLFFFGTYLPHRGDHENPPHNARSQSLNHVWAFVSCYFFGYHFEHHDQPYLPWWKLAAARESNGL